MAELHPFFVHFPIALVMVASAFDAYAAVRNQVDLHKTAFILQIMAALAALPSAFSGNLAEIAVRSNEALAAAIAESLDRHTDMGNILVWLVIIFAVARVFAVLERKEWALSGWVFPSLALLLAVFTLGTGLAGGELSRNILEYFVGN
ncbi:MAG: hypothetical protein K9M49_06590 [Candidatus Marinimicrobia bacterium]|nr:hypothetical protein [Candidatus Neomarinimicrobiota bacterium]MCF7850785.1 hypothetical protein [Candidatus Neomarinimicrobiota bacterium]MCF7904805.1 hypothetical protein [Candidatus Neomarinimicrobiota bacterium]